MKTEAFRKAFLHDPRLDADGYPSACPFNSRRAGQSRAKVDAMGLLSGDDRFEAAPEALSRAELERFHTPEYVDALERAGRGALAPDDALRFGLGTPDCPIFAGMYDFVRLAAGGSVTGARMILDGRADIVFNPSGGFHHAQRDHAAGFCFINDVVLAAQVLAGAGRRVLFLDIDVHHGDGVQDAFYDRSDVMTISLHESGRTLFPGTGFEDEIGTGEGRGYCVNVPLPVGTYDDAYERAFRSAVLPLIGKFDPDVFILELGMDTLAGDPLAHLHLTNNVLADIVQQVVDFDRPILAVGGGGYYIANTVRGWALCWSVLCGEHAGQQDLMIGMGGVMLENADWLGGLRDRMLLTDGGRRDTVDADIGVTIQRLRSTLFPLHGL
jgi:acetoin utilization protein AcuC